jgi:NADH dehydrogenase
MQGKLVTIFGGSGFLGRYVVQRLARLGAQVRVGIRDANNALFLKTMGDVGQVTPVSLNVLDEKEVEDLISGSDYVVNLIGILYESGTTNTFENLHVTVPTLIAKACTKKKVKRLVHISAIGANAKSESKYAKTKAKGEKKILDNFPKATIVRPSILFGEEDKFFNRFATMAKFSPFLPLIGGGHNKVQPVYVCDVADAIVQVLADPHVQQSPHEGKVYELGGPKIYSFEELLAFIMEQTRRYRILIPISYYMATMIGKVAQCLPSPLLTADQVKLLKQDNIADPKLNGFKKLGITPATVEMVVPTYLNRYRYSG